MAPCALRLAFNLLHFLRVELGYSYQFPEGQRHPERGGGGGERGDLVEGGDEVGLRIFRLIHGFRMAGAHPAKYLVFLILA